MCWKDSVETSILMALHFGGKEEYFKQGFSKAIVQVLNTPILLQGPGCPKRYICNSQSRKVSKISVPYPLAILLVIAMITKFYKELNSHLQA